MAAHVAAESDRFNCKKCPWGKHCDDSNPAPFEQFVIQLNGVPFMSSRTCFLPKITIESHALMRLHVHYKKGFLPRAGGICDQSQLFIEGMEVLEQTFGEIDMQREKERQARLKQ